jgi:hypothetical protein
MGAFIFSNAFSYRLDYRKTKDIVLSKKMRIELSESAEFCDHRLIPDALQSPALAAPCEDITKACPP